MAKGLFGRVQDEVEAREKTPGLSMADILSRPDELRGLVNWMMRQEQVELAQVANYLGQDPEQARAMLTSLKEKGFVREIDLRGKLCYRVRLALKHKPELSSNLWHSLNEKIQ